ncbi:MAG: alpha-amylase family protein [Acidobacteriota bacterium]
MCKAVGGACVLVASAGVVWAQWWEREPLRIIDVGSVFGEIAARGPAEVAARKAGLLFNAEHLQIMGHQKGLDDSGFFFATQLAGKANEDYLKKYLPEAKARGLRVMVYFNVHWYNLPFGDRHPDWLQIKEDGKPLTNVYETGTSFCVNSPWREWCFQALRDLCAYPIDGIFYDGPIFFPETCYCRWCREKYRKAHGTELPSKRERRGKAFRSLVEFQARSLADYLRDSRLVVKSVNPEIAFYMNGGVRGANWATGRLNRVLIAEQDILGSEGGFISGDLTRVPMWKPGVTAKLLETQSPTKPRVIFSAAGHKPWTFSILPAPELRLLYADTIANAASVWFGFPPSELDQPEMKALAEMNRYLARAGAWYLDTRSEARVALVWSDASANFYAGSEAQLIDIDRVPARSEVGNLDGEFNGMAEALVRSLTPFDVIDDVTLEQEPLTRYAAILLPNTAVMSEQAAGRLREYVRGGGNLLATFETSLYDETGLRRNEFALADVLGVSDARKIVGPTRWDFMRPRGDSPLVAGLRRDFVPSTAYHVRVSVKGGQALAHFTRPLAGRYDGIPEVSEDPALVVNQLGRGRAVYFAGDLGNSIQGFRLGEHLRLVRNALRELAPSPVEIANAPQSLEVVLRSQQNGKRLLVHLVNFTGEMTRPIQRILPLENLRIRVRVKATKAQTLMHPRALALRRVAAEQVEFVLPRMEEYEVVVIE